MLEIGVVVLVLLLIIAVAGCAWLLYRQRLQRPPSDSSSPPWSELERGLALRRSFRAAVSNLRRHIATEDFLYRSPWVLMLGTPGAGKTTLLSDSRLTPGLISAQVEPAARDYRWWYFNQGIVLDLKSELGGGAWQLVLRLLQRHRPRRPLDAIVLTLPAEILLAEPDTLRNVSEQLAKSLWDVQRQLGLRLPVYVCISKCDGIPGFGAFCRALPERLQDNMLGWSSPYGLESAYQDVWAQEVFDTTEEALLATQAELFAGRNRCSLPDEVFQLPTTLRGLQDGLSTVLGRVFNATAYCEGMILRGVYFCGDSSEPLASQEQEPKRTIAFFTDLLQQKVFRETAAVKPVRGALVAYRRYLLVAQTLSVALIVVWGSGLAWSYGHMRDAVQKTLLPVLSKIAEDQHYIDSAQDVTPAWFKRNSVQLLEGMAGMRVEQLSSIFMPFSYSWFTDIDEDLEAAMEVAFSKVILRSMQIAFDNKAHEVITHTQAGTKDTPTAKTTPDFTEFRDLAAFVQNITELDGNIRRFNELQASGKGDLATLAKLASYTLNVELPASFFDNQRYYEAALHHNDFRAVAVDPGRYAESAHKRFTALFDKLLEAVFQQNLVGDLRELIQIWNEIQASPQTLLNPGADQNLVSRAERVSTALASGQADWLFRERFDLDGRYAETLDRVEASPTLGKALREHAESETARRFVEVRADLQTRTGSAQGVLLKGKESMGLAADFNSLISFLKDALSQGFIAARDPQVIATDFIEGSRLLWNQTLLDEAIRIYHEYEHYVAQQLPKLRAELRAPVEQMLENEAAKTIEDRVARAQAFSVVVQGRVSWNLANALNEEVENFGQANTRLAELLSIFRVLKQDHIQARLSQVVNWQAATILQSVDKVLEEGRPFLAESEHLKAWSGSGPLAYTIFGLADQAGLEEYLAVQVGRVQNLAHMVKPVIELLTNERTQQMHLDVPRLAKWEGIQQDLERYQNKGAGSSVAALEKFLLKDLNGLSLNRCLVELAPSGSVTMHGDFFAHRLQQLRTQVHGHCVHLASAKSAGAFAAISQQFNRELAEHFPFQGKGSNDEVEEADLPSVQRFFRSFAELPQFTAEPGSRSDPNALLLGADAARFIARLEQVRTFLGNGADKTHELGVPAYDLTPEFRANRSQEVDANKIAEWRLESGGRVISSDQAQHSVRWNYGDPVRVVLRWAINAPVVPVDDGSNPALQVRDRTAVFEYKNAWALFKLLARHDENADYTGGDTHTPLLKFSVPIQAVDASEADNKPSAVAMAFIRLNITAPEQTLKLALPSFPERAPTARPASAAWSLNP